MQTELPITFPTDTGNPLASRAIPPVERRIVLGMWMGLLLFGAVVLCPVDRDPGGYWLPVWFCLWFAQACLLALWAALAQQPLSVRLPRAAGLMAVLTVVTAWAINRSLEDGSILLALAVPVICLVDLVPLVLVRWLFGWRIAVPAEQRLTDQRATQFSLRQLLIWIGFMSVLLAWAKCVLPDGKTLQKACQGDAILTQLRNAAVAAAVCLPMLIPSVGLVLARRNRLRFALGFFLAVSLIFTAMLLLLSSTPVDWRKTVMLLLLGTAPVDWERAAQIACMAGSFLGVLLGTLLLLRLCGYRLLRRKEDSQAADSPAAIDTAMPCVGTWQTLSPYLVIAILLLGFTLCWPAWKLEPARRELALRRAWDAVGIGAWGEAGEVRAITFWGNSARVEGLQKLQELRSAPTFESLTSSRLTDDQTHYLRGLATMKELDLGYSPLADAGLAQLDDLDKLQTLDLRYTRITDEGLKYLQRFPSLEDVSLQGTRINGSGFAQLAGPTRLKSLHLNATAMTDEGLAHLKRFTDLNCLELKGTRITDVGLAHLAGLHKLQRLDLKGTSITDAGLAHLGALESLEQLSLSNTQTGDAGLAHLTHLKRLVHLAPGERTTDVGLKHIQELKSLEFLWLAGFPITDAGLAHLTGLQKLKDLVLTNTEITDAGVKYLQSLENLESLWLEGTQITDTGLAQLQSLKKLRFLNPLKTQVTFCGIKKFEQALPECEVGSAPITPCPPSAKSFRVWPAR